MKTKLERIRELRELGESLHDAQLIVNRQDLDTEIRDAKTIDDLRSILWALNARGR